MNIDITEEYKRELKEQNFDPDEFRKKLLAENASGSVKHWTSIRQEALERDGNRCTKCGNTENLHVHHLTYENKYESLEDLITLCRACHIKAHKDTIIPHRP